MQLKKRPFDGKVEVWAECKVTWGGAPGYRELGFETVEPVLVEVLDPAEGERSEFLASRRDSAPLWAGDGFGSSAKED